VISKVPVVTVSFWILKILTTGMGEAASDALVRAGGVVAVAATAVVLMASFVVQFRASRYIPGVYWLAVAMVGVFGTMAADIPHFLGTPLWATSTAYLLAVLVIFLVWYRTEGTLSFASITSGRREAFYWAAVVATFALGTAVGDLTADNWGLGNLVSGIMFAVAFAVPFAARRWLGLNAVAAFWIAYVLTRRWARRSPTGWARPRSAAVWGSRWRSSPACGPWRSPDSWSTLPCGETTCAPSRAPRPQTGRSPRDRPSGPGLTSPTHGCRCGVGEGRGCCPVAHHAPRC
jgi:uncharacterized membrane-anchored protein